ncbi:MAG: Lrp/AsnC family transcriptional regulator [Parvibaculum sp.]|nr:Lrp/AsnC family transcriptional regulator [Parvibaculum sp.]
MRKDRLVKTRTKTGPAVAAFTPDELDYRLIAELRLDPQSSNRQIARSLDVSEVTVAARLSRMREARAMRLLLQKDVRRMSLDYFAFIEIQTSNRSPEAIAEEMSHIAELSTVAVIAGNPSIFLQANVRDKESLLHVVDDRLARIKGVGIMEVSLVLDVYKWTPDLGTLALPIEESLPVAEIWDGADELDRAIVSLLTLDGHLSNREIARRLDVSEGAVRQRLKKMIDGGYVRLGVVVDPVVFDRSEMALLKVSAPGPLMAALRKRMMTTEACVFVGRTTGKWGLTAAIICKSRDELQEVIRRNLKLDLGGYVYELTEATRSFKYRYDLVYIEQ